MEVIANNIANASTPAYKAERLLFSEYLSKGSNNNQSVSFVQDSSVIRDTSEGALSETKNPFDLAIKGDGYFVVQGQSEPNYSRNGRLHLNEDGKLVNNLNMPVLDESDRPITIEPGIARIEISQDGTIKGENGEIGRIKIVRFDDEQSLTRLSSALYRTDAAPQPATESKVFQGMLEESNVRPIVEITNMIDAHRSYQNSQQMIQNEHERVLKSIETLTHAA